MKKKVVKTVIRTVVIVLVLLVVAYSVQYARGTSQRQIEARYAELDSALQRRDIAAYMALLTDDYSEIRLNQKPKDRAHAEAIYKAVMADWSNYKPDPVEVDAFERNGNEAKVTVKRVASGQLVDKKGAFGSKGAIHTMKIFSACVDKWRIMDGRWMLKHRVIAMAAAKVDGKPLPGGTVHDDD